MFSSLVLLTSISHFAQANIIGSEYYKLIVDHDKMVMTNKTYPYDLAMSRFSPSLHLPYGCDVYPAVNPDGKVNAGLWPPYFGLHDDTDCSKLFNYPSQVYVRFGTVPGAWAYLYTYFLPRLSFSKTHSTRHDHRFGWLTAVVFFEPWVDGEFISVAWFRNLNDEFPMSWHKTNGRDFFSTLDHPKLAIEGGGVRNTHWTGIVHHIIEWWDLSQVQRDALNAFNFGYRPSCICPVCDGPGKFEDFLKAAWAAPPPDRESWRDRDWDGNDIPDHP